MDASRRPPMFRPTGGLSQTPLLQTHVGSDDDEDAGGGNGYGGPPSPEPSPPLRPTFSRGSTMRSRSPAGDARAAARRRYTYAGLALCVSLVSFTVQTELAAYVQRVLGWDKAYCMLYVTHGSWVVLWPAQLAILRARAGRGVPWRVFWRRHTWLLRTTAQMVQSRSPLDAVVPRTSSSFSSSPMLYMLRTTAFVTSALTIAGLSWYVAVNKTTPADLTAIYNCSAFFAYAFSVPLLHERLRLDKSIAVAVAIAGVMVVAYGGSKDDATPPPLPNPPSNEPNDVSPSHNAALSTRQELDGATRFLGNLIIGVGSVLYGLYEVLYKRFACPPDGTSPGRGMIFANTFGSLMGAFTVLVLWIPLPILHVLGWETFELPTGKTAWLLGLSVVMNAMFSGSFLVLISLTSPVLSSVAALLTIFLVAVVDWLWTGQPLSAGAIVGGCLIMLAFGMLSWSTWREMMEDERRKQMDLSEGEDEEVDEN